MPHARQALGIQGKSQYARGPMKFLMVVASIPGLTFQVAPPSPATVTAQSKGGRTSILAKSKASQMWNLQKLHNHKQKKKRKSREDGGIVKSMGDGGEGDGKGDGSSEGGGVEDGNSEDDGVEDGNSEGDGVEGGGIGESEGDGGEGDGVEDGNSEGDGMEDGGSGQGASVRAMEVAVRGGGGERGGGEGDVEDRRRHCWLQRRCRQHPESWRRTETKPHKEEIRH
ncbi:golgin subfamily A member 6-like protein 2 [Telopea speciosissima]|uniref:golgin subfamily A member 6-like protein 2 n=1 Tax=Telopea speciosissima TaxID=54955 RepID=UPI001CC560BE|nr:golgin subfamily A member 6-like protein 2 [Telopea speciosissima]